MERAVVVPDLLVPNLLAPSYTNILVCVLEAADIPITALDTIEAARIPITALDTTLIAQRTAARTVVVFAERVLKRDGGPVDRVVVQHGERAVVLPRLAHP